MILWVPLAPGGFLCVCWYMRSFHNVMSIPENLVPNMIFKPRAQAGAVDDAEFQTRPPHFTTFSCLRVLGALPEKTEPFNLQSGLAVGYFTITRLLRTLNRGLQRSKRQILDNIFFI